MTPLARVLGNRKRKRERQQKTVGGSYRAFLSGLGFLVANMIFRFRFRLLFLLPFPVVLPTPIDTVLNTRILSYLANARSARLIPDRPDALLNLLSGPGVGYVGI